MKIGLIGLGRMGEGIAGCLLKAGFDLVVWNRTPSRATPLEARGARIASSIADLATEVDVVLSCLTGDEAILEAMTSQHGILAALRRDAVHVCMMTISPKCADELERMHAAHGSHFVAGPLSGRPDVAAAGALLTYLAGPTAAVERCKSVCAAYAKQIVVVGERPRAANCLKLSINFTLCSIMEVFGEAYSFAEKCGVNGELLNDWYQMAFAHPAIKTYANKILSRDFGTTVGYSMVGGLKDVRLMISTAAELGMTLETAQIVEEKTLAAIAAGRADDDWTGFTEITRRRAGLD